MKKKKKYVEPKSQKRRYTMNIAYLSSVAGVFTLAALLMIILPRESFSETEKRELAKYPELTAEEYFSGEYTKDVAKWFSDTVPKRDSIMELSASLQDMKGFHKDDIKLIGVSEVNDDEQTSSQPTLIQTKPKPPESKPQDNTSSENSSQSSESSSSGITNSEISAPDQDPVDNVGDIEMNDNGCVVVGTRGLMMYGGNLPVGTEYAKTLNRYKAALPDVNVYCMLIPTACEFYSPPALDGYHGSQLKNINNVIANLEGVKAVDAYTPLAEHTSEDIYLRTDHHWAPLGGYYAAKAFAEAAGVPFADLSQYTKRVNHGFCGSMYGYTNYDPALKNNPEDFVYYVPKNDNYTTTYYNYMFDDNWNICGAYDPYDASFFLDYGDNRGDNYCTFMGGDAKIVRVKTDVKNGRKLAIFKDSFGNAVPGYLFSSFEEIYVLDLRYFSHNGVDFMREKGITDLLFANNIFTAGNSYMVGRYNTILDQADYGY